MATYNLSEKSYPLLHYWIKLGYASRGCLYAIIGTLALLVALNIGGDLVNTREAIKQLLQQPYGFTLVWALAVGILGYSLWRFAQSTYDIDDHGISPKGLAVRAGLLMSGLTHTVLAVWAFLLPLDKTGDSKSGNNGVLNSTVNSLSDQTPFTASEIMTVVFVALGIVLIIVGIAHVFKGWTERFDRYIDFPPQHKPWMKKLCHFGLSVRGVVWIVLGGIVTHSAWVSHHAQNKTIADALRTLQDTIFGGILLMVVAVGLVAFANYSFIEALYRKIQLPDV